MARGVIRRASAGIPIASTDQDITGGSFIDDRLSLQIEGIFVNVVGYQRTFIHRDNGDVGCFTLQADLSESGEKRGPVQQRWIRCLAQGYSDAVLTCVVSRSTVIKVKRGVLLRDGDGSVAGSRVTGLRQVCDTNAVSEKGAQGECLCSLVAKGADVPTRYVEMHLDSWQ